MDIRSKVSLVVGLVAGLAACSYHAVKSPAYYHGEVLSCDDLQLRNVKSKLSQIELEQELSLSIGSKIPSYDSWVLGLSSVSITEAENLISNGLSEIDKELEALALVSEFTEVCSLPVLNKLGIENLVVQKKEDFSDFKALLSLKGAHLQLAKEDFVKWERVAHKFSSELMYESDSARIEIDGWFYSTQGQSKSLTVLFTIAPKTEDGSIKLYPAYTSSSEIKIPQVRLVDQDGVIYPVRATIPSVTHRDDRVLTSGGSIQFSTIFDYVPIGSSKVLTLTLPSDFFGERDVPIFHIGEKLFKDPNLFLNSFYDRINSLGLGYIHQ